MPGNQNGLFQKRLNYLLIPLLLFLYAPIRFVTIMGILFSILGFIWTAYIVLRTLLVGDLSAGWPSLIAILLVGFGVTNISLGIIAEYLWRTLDVSRGRPVYIIDEIIELKLS